MANTLFLFEEFAEEKTCSLPFFEQPKMKMNSCLICKWLFKMVIKMLFLKCFLLACFFVKR